MSRNFYLCLLSVILSFTSCAFAKYVQGDIISNDDWMYLSKFCYSTAGIGNLTWQAWSEDDSHLLIVFYDDVPTSWDAVYPHRNELSCWEKVAMAKGNRTLRTGVMDFQLFADYERPHFWYAAIANCGGSGKMDLQFDLHWTNYGGLWSKELSYDAQGVPETYLFFWLLFMIGIVIHARCIWVLMQQASYHPIVKLLTATIVLEALYQLCMFIHFAVYIHDGVGAPGLSGLGEMLGMIAQLVFMFLLLLLAKGWAITKTEVSDKKIMIVGIAIFLLAYITLFIWQNVGEDPASTLYVFESAPGIIVLVLRCVALLWFLWCLRSTHLDETTPEKKRFYFIFGIAYTVWWAALPFFVLLSIGFSAWYRFKVVTTLFLCVNTLGIFGLAFLLWPSRARAYFQITRTDLLLGNKSSPYETL